jgi:hypothetical protein
LKLIITLFTLCKERFFICDLGENLLFTLILKVEGLGVYYIPKLTLLTSLVILYKINDINL